MLCYVLYEYFFRLLLLPRTAKIKLRSKHHLKQNMWNSVWNVGNASSLTKYIDSQYEHLSTSTNDSETAS